MNLVGKIFIVLIFIMSLVFMSFAVAVYGTHKSWKEAVEKPRDPARPGDAGLKFRLADAKLKQEELAAQLLKLTEDVSKEKTDLNMKLAKSETARTEVAKQFEDLKTERDELAKKDKLAIAALDTAQQNLDKLTNEVEGLRKEIRTVQDDRNKQFEKVVKITDQVQQAKGETKRLEERGVQLASQVARQKSVLDAHGLNEYTPLDKLPPPLRGKVLAVSADDLIEVSLGKDDGLKTGHTLEVYRENKYLGRVEVLNIDTDRAVAKILKDFRKAPIQKGDNVATRLKVS
jgi:myosin heavy subunit